MVQESYNFIYSNSITLFGGLYFLLGCLIAAFISHILAKDKDRQLNRAVALYEAAKTLRHSLHDILLEINQGQEHASILVRKYFDIHTLNAWEFECVLHSHRVTKRRFRKTWEHYQKFCKTQYSENIDVTELPETPDKKILTEFETHIKSLLNFTVNY